eukprot:TRINITY_DN5879_c0_g1_i1.p1 TRINITY_DN5879_c0_g1~~TRINITY_DN5879_c0_g1_i1.p1  ORF type:complete len:248 (+),score=35.92 TRINITY_DN5879_c0_g1_i1:108-746(+)
MDLFTSLFSFTIFSIITSLTITVMCSWDGIQLFSLIFSLFFLLASYLMNVLGNPFMVYDYQVGVPLSYEIEVLLVFLLVYSLVDVLLCAVVLMDYFKMVHSVALIVLLDFVLLGEASEFGQEVFVLVNLVVGYRVCFQLYCLLESKGCHRGVLRLLGVVVFGVVVSSHVLLGDYLLKSVPDLVARNPSIEFSVVAMLYVALSFMDVVYRGRV